MLHCRAINVDSCMLLLQVYAAAAELVTRGGMGVGALLGAEAIKCALHELYGTVQAKKRPAESGDAHFRAVYVISSHLR